MARELMIDSGERLIWLASVMSVLVAYPGWAQPISRDAAAAIEVTETEIPRLDQLEPSATTVDEWLAQVSPTFVQVTEVRLNPLADGIEVILETTGELTPNAPNIVGNALITEIPNASLAGDAFRQSNPVAGIALVEVTNLPGNRVRLAVTGTTAPPTAAVRTEAQQVTFSIAAQTSGSVEAPDDALQVVVTGERWFLSGCCCDCRLALAFGHYITAAIVVVIIVIVIKFVSNIFNVIINFINCVINIIGCIARIINKIADIIDYINNII
ncbi:AMIN domain-containing protein [Leptolyngbya sp. 7M]|uniref:AMIN domain-containing protein n=1 Tax=Leptolyngbya sp. 7M TaxID=2812896 RepID=UPI001B8C9D34|nr:AMIN domain-containing protein [Leptolyngbya sp. 7M]QYO62336.1 AMIN domain-containing protein [Leptolyngbya sp. 7M]